MGAGASSLIELPERLTYDECVTLVKNQGLNIVVDRVRFDIIMDPKDKTISRSQAMQFVENKLPKIFSINPLCVPNNISSN
jgi:RNA-binding protein YlmH